MEDSAKAKKIVRFGAIIGGIMSLAISILMDTFFAGPLQGTWTDAIAKDLNTLFSLGVSRNSIIVYVVFAFILGILTAFGALMGFIFSFFLYKLLSFLSDME